ncbi:small G protein, GTPase SAR1 [Synechococcus sp. PCC 7502]|uniref:AAA family ATPase n=1 Tax=Synechococcus sp. PCC 7502 TaxID=1173263 RepID=UPI00029F9C86|nr:AAA family ATPase [Synechococcus sp. PCC 7502]AFY74802.1 small G protein, GTPase SAR1 [Synechococcus sp. PCC 7502]
MHKLDIDLRHEDTQRAVSALVEGQSILVLGDDGGGKTTLAENVANQLRSRGYTVAIADYGGSAKKTFTVIAEELGVDTVRVNSVGKDIPLTADQLRDAIAKVLLTEPRPILICDNAHRYPSSLRYWLEEICADGGVIFLLATRPPRRDIFLKMPRTELKSIQTDRLRSLMIAEAQELGVNVDNSKLAELQERSGGNPYLAKRAVREEVLGLGDGEAGDHTEYVDGTPFLIAAVSLVAILRFIGLGLGDKSLYIIGGIFTVLAITLRVFFMQINKKSTKLGSKG